jgi:hypothetical protein
MRTTIDLNAELLRLAKKRAADEGRPLRAIFEDALRALLQTRPRAGDRYELRWRTQRGKVQPGVRLDDRDSLFDLMEGRR